MKPVFILLFSICLTSQVMAGGDTGKCKYYNDPHLIPFPDEPGAPQSQYICQNNCTEILIKNEFLEIIVNADPQGAYPIVEYTLIFFATAANPQSCAITNSIANPTPPPLECPPGTPANTIVSPSGTAQHHFHLTENIQVEIWQQKSWFNFLITQSFDLIKQSTGVCIEWECPYEGPASLRKKRQVQGSDVINQIIELSVKAAIEGTSEPVNDELVQALRTAVFYDISTTFNQQYAESIITSILRDSINQYEGKDNFADKLREIDTTAQKVICQVGEEINALIAGLEKPVCKSVGKTSKCLLSVDYSKQC